MNYCFHYIKSIRDYSKVQEIAIEYLGQHKALKNFIKNNPDKRIILQVKDIQTFMEQHLESAIAAVIDDTQGNITLCLDIQVPAREIDKEIIDYLDILNEMDIAYFFNHIITDTEKLNYYLELGVSDVYIAERLGFELSAVKAVCRRYKVTVRAFPNVAQISREEKDNPLQAFFVRPDDVEYLSRYIDVLEFWGPLDRQETYLKIYQQGYWYADLRALIIGLDDSLDNKGILPTWGIIRANCHRDCLKGKHCRSCETLSRISTKFADQSIMIKHKKAH